MQKALDEGHIEYLDTEASFRKIVNRIKDLCKPI